eukprot:7111395-Pyramimonas_sp.AAC.1
MYPADAVSQNGRQILIRRSVEINSIDPTDAAIRRETPGGIRRRRGGMRRVYRPVSPLRVDIVRQ